MTARRITGFLLAIAGAAGFTACLKAMLAGFRDVIKVDGGYCASGGPYVIAHQCSNADIRLLLIGIFGGLLAVAVYAIGTAMLGKPASSAGLLAWTALFGLLGWNFIATHGSVITGVVFLVMAAGGFVVLLSSVTSDLRNPRRHGGLPERLARPGHRMAAKPGGHDDRAQRGAQPGAPRQRAGPDRSLAVRHRGRPGPRSRAERGADHRAAMTG